MQANLEERCAQRLRELRRKKGVTLHEFEALSNGAVKAVVLGSYERGTRAISLARLEQLAEIYEVSIEYFLRGESFKAMTQSEATLIFDLRRIRRLESISNSIAPVKRYLNTIAQRRSDWNGEVLSLRQGDSQLLAFICDLEPDALLEELRIGGFLFASEVSGQRSL